MKSLYKLSICSIVFCFMFGAANEPQINENFQLPLATVDVIHFVDRRVVLRLPTPARRRNNNRRRNDPYIIRTINNTNNNNIFNTMNLQIPIQLHFEILPITSNIFVPITDSPQTETPPPTPVIRPQPDPEPEID